MAHSTKHKATSDTFQCAPDCAECIAVRQAGAVVHLAAPRSSRPVTLAAPASPALLLLYRDGLTNLNGEASRLLLFDTSAEAVQLLPPTGPSCPSWLLLAPPIMPGARQALTGRTDRSRHLRFRSRELGIGTFSLLPEGQETFSFQLEQEQPGRYRLVPVSK